MSQLLLMAPGTVREFDFQEPLPDPANELHLRGPISGHARLTRTSEGVLAHSDYHACVVLECARCLEEALAQVDGDLDEEFLPTTDIRTGLPVPLPGGVEDDQPFIDEHHEINLNEILRQNILTNLPIQPLCSENCPGLCLVCGDRLEAGHQAHTDSNADSNDEELAPVDPASPFAKLAVLMRDDDEETN